MRKRLNLVRPDKPMTPRIQGMTVAGAEPVQVVQTRPVVGPALGRVSTENYHLRLAFAELERLARRLGAHDGVDDIRVKYGLGGGRS